jgi:DNA modification methylase
MKDQVIFGDSQDMSELDDNCIQLVVTSPPYFNAPFDYPGLFTDYDEYLKIMRNVSIEIKRVLSKGRIVAYVVDDTLIDGKKYPVVADLIKIFIEEGFKYRDRITWIKPEGYIRISRRSGVVLQHPYPMYFYPDNIQESILLFQNGKFNYKSISQETREISQIDKEKLLKEKWYMNIWRITNVLPSNNTLEKGIAAFPDEIPYRLINLFSYKNEIVLDPFMGSSTTLKVANELTRKFVGYDIDRELLPIVKTKLALSNNNLKPEQDYAIKIREDSKSLRTKLQDRVKEKIV